MTNQSVVPRMTVSMLLRSVIAEPDLMAIDEMAVENRRVESRTHRVALQLAFAALRFAPRRNEPLTNPAHACRNVLRPCLGRCRHRRREILRAPRHQGRTHQCDARRRGPLARRAGGCNLKRWPAHLTALTLSR